MPYFVGTTDVTPWEPTIGWYYVQDWLDDNENIRERIVGPFNSRQDALDSMDGDEI